MNIQNGYINPMIIEERELHVTTMDVFSRLMVDRSIFVGVPIDDNVANVIEAQLLYLDSVNNDDITMYINTPGGSVSAGLGIYDTMRMIRSRVKTVCVGLAASMGSILLAAGDERQILPHAKVMIHQPLGGVSGQASDILIEAREIEKCRDILCDILTAHSGKDRETVFKDMDRNYWMTAEEAKEYGLVDQVLKLEPKPKKNN